MRKDTWLFCSDIIFRVLEFGFYNVRRVVDGCYKKIVLSCHSGRCYVLVLSVICGRCLVLLTIRTCTMCMCLVLLIIAQHQQVH